MEGAKHLATLIAHRVSSSFFVGPHFFCFVFLFLKPSSIVCGLLSAVASPVPLGSCSFNFLFIRLVLFLINLATTPLVP